MYTNVFSFRLIKNGQVETRLSGDIVKTQEEALTHAKTLKALHQLDGVEIDVQYVEWHFIGKV